MLDEESLYIDAAPLPPAPRQPIRSHERGVKLRRKPHSALDYVSQCSRINVLKNIQWSWVTKSLSQISFDSILGREVNLFEELGRDRDATSCAYPSQRCVTIHALIIQVIWISSIGTVVVSNSIVLFEMTSISTVDDTLCLGVLFSCHCC